MTSKHRDRGMIIGLGVVVTLMLALSVTTKNITAAGTFTVSNTMDSGSGSLRQAIMDANAAGGGIIDATGVSGTIELLTALPNLDSDITINGPSSATLIVGRSKVIGRPIFRIFAVNSGKTVSISSLTIKNGQVESGSGAGIYNLGTMTISTSTIANNETQFDGTGGGIYNQGTVTISNSTLTGNYAVVGGGIYNVGTMTISNSTLAGNLADIGAGFKNLGILNLQSTIVAKNIFFNDISGAFTSLGHNLIGITQNSSGGDPSLGDLLNVDPKLEIGVDGIPLLKDNGGPTPTIALLCGSPAIDKGKNALMQTTDQRGTGFVRILDDLMVLNATGGDGTDIGAFELQAACFDLCLQNDGGGALLLINSLTGDYLLCCGGQSYVGKGTVNVSGSVVTLQDNSSNRRVQAKVDRSTNRGTASLQSPVGTTRCTISDRDTRNNSCACAVGG